MISYLNSKIRIIKNGINLFASPQITIGQRLNIIKYFIKTKLFRQDIIRSVEIIHTLKCNCRCDFCSNEKLSEKHQVMSKQNVKYTINKLVNHGVVGIIFLGGESMTDPNFFDYIRYTRKKNAIPILSTNGTLLTKENIKKLVSAGIFSIIITIHDTIPNKHNNIVKLNNALETVIKAIPMLKKKKIQITLKTIYSPESVNSGAFKRILNLAKKHKIKMNVNPIMPVGKGFKEENLLNEKQKNNYINTTMNENTITTHTKSRYDCQCPAGSLYLGILPDGEILPCYFLPVSIGNIKNTSIKTAQNRSSKLKIFKKGADSCIVAMNTTFYNKIIKELYSGKYDLPVRVYENPELKKLFQDFSYKFKKQNERIKFT